MIQRIVRKALWGLFFFAFFENFFVPILTSGGLAAVSASAFAALYSAFGKYDVVHTYNRRIGSVNEYGWLISGA